MTRIPSAKQMEDSRKIHHFRDTHDERVDVVTAWLPNGEYGAWVDGQEDGATGLGVTMLSAIVDLKDQLWGEL